MGPVFEATLSCRRPAGHHAVTRYSVRHYEGWVSAPLLLENRDPFRPEEPPPGTFGVSFELSPWNPSYEGPQTDAVIAQGV